MEIRLLDITSADIRISRAHTLGALFAAGASVSTVVIVATLLADAAAWANANLIGIGITVVLTAGSAALLFTRWSTATPQAVHALTFGGSLLIAACQLLAGSPSAAVGYAMLYVWVVLHSAMFFGWPIVAFHLVTTGLFNGAVLYYLGAGQGLVPFIALATGTQIAVALVVAVLAQQIRRIEDVDPLTGLSRPHLAERTLIEWFQRPHLRKDAAPVVIALDVRNYKELRFSDGHETADQVLAAVAKACLQVIRGSDLGVRASDDRLLFLLNNVTFPAAKIVAKRLERAAPPPARCEFGIAIWDRISTPSELIELANEALVDARVARRSDGT